MKRFDFIFNLNIGKKRFSIIETALLAFLFIQVGNNLSAQSFLSDEKEYLIPRSVEDVVSEEEELDQQAADTTFTISNQSLTEEKPDESHDATPDHLESIFIDEISDPTTDHFGSIWIDESGDSTADVFQSDQAFGIVDDEVEGESQLSLVEISDLIDKGEFNQALAVLNELELASDDFVGNEYRYFLTIKAHFHLGSFADVERLSDSYFLLFNNGQYSHWVFYYLSSVLYSQKKPLRMVYLVTEDLLSNLSERERQSLRKALIENAVRNKEYLSAIYFLEDEEGRLAEGYEKWIDEIIDNINDQEDIDQILERFEYQDIYLQIVLRKIELSIRDGMLGEAERRYSDLVLNSDLGIDQYSQLARIYDTIDLAQNTQPYRIGVILPVTHSRHKVYAREVLDGLELAINQYRIMGRSIELVIKDSAQKDNSPEYKKLSPKYKMLAKQELVKQHVKNLVENHGVIAILGPLARSTSQAAGEAAKAYKVPVISFSLTENIGADSPSLFRFQRSEFQEARILANYAVDYLNARRFVLFYQSNSKSFEVMQAFAEEARSKGAEVVGIARIGRKQQDFTDAFKSITGGFSFKSEEELEELKRTRERPAPFVDFDAMFLPVDIRTLKIVIDFARLFDARKTWFLSGREINDRQNQLMKSTSRLRFVGTHSVSSDKTYLRPFFEKHWQFYNYRSNYDPPSDYTIYGYESLELLAKLLGDAKLHNREALRNHISGLNDFKLLTGSVSTDKKGELNKKLKILKISGSDTVEVF